MAQSGANINSNAESFHDLNKQKQIIQHFKNEMIDLEKQQLDAENELKDFQNENRHVYVAEEQSVASVKEFNELIRQEDIKLTELNEILTDFQFQRKQLEYDLGLQQQKLEDNRNKLQEKTNLLSASEEELENFQDEKTCLEEQNEILKNEKSRLQRIIESIDGRIQQVKSEMNQIPQSIEKFRGETELIDEDIRNTQENIQDKANETIKLEKKFQENEQELLKFQRKNDEFDEELDRINNLINQILLIIEMKENNPKDFEQFRANLIKDLQQAENELKEVQEQILPITKKSQETKRSMQLLEQTLDKLVQESTVYENKSRLCKEGAELVRQRITQNQKEYERLKDKIHDIDEDLKFEEQDKLKVKYEIKDLDCKRTKFKTEVTSISEHLKTMVTDRDDFVIQLNNKKHTRQELHLELFALKEKRIEAEENLRKQQQIVHNARQQFETCRDKSLQCYLSERRVELNKETVEENLKLAEQIFDSAKGNFEAIVTYIKTNPKAETVGYTTKEKLVEKYQQAIENCKKDVKNRCDLLKRRTQDLDESEINTEKAKHMFGAAQNELQKYENEVITLQNQISSIEQNLLQQSNDINITLEKYQSSQQKYEQYEEKIRAMKKEIESIEQKLLISNRILAVINMNLNRLNKKQANLNLNIEQVKNNLRNYQQEYEEERSEFQMIVDNMNDNRLEQTSLKQDITQKRIENHTIEFELIREYLREHRIKGKINNFSQILLISNTNIIDLQSQIIEQQLHYDNKIQEQLKTEDTIEILKKNEESLQRDIEQYVHERRQLERDLPSKCQDLIEQKLKSQQFQYDLNQYQNELQTNKDEYHQYKEDLLVLNNLFNENRQNMEKCDTKISKLEEVITNHIEIEKNMRITLENDNKESEENKYKIEVVTSRISNFLEQYNASNYQQNIHVDGLKSIQDKKMNILNKLIEYEQKMLQQQLKLTLLNHQITWKWNDIRNYKEKQSYYTLDLYNDESDEKQ